MTATTEKIERISVKRRQTACVDHESSRYDLEYAYAVPASDGGAWIVSTDARCAAFSRSAESDIDQMHAIDPSILGRKKRSQKLAITGESATLDGEPVPRASYESFPHLDTVIRSAADDMQGRRRVKIDAKLLSNIATATSDGDADGIIELWLSIDWRQPIVVAGNTGVGLLMPMYSGYDDDRQLLQEQALHAKTELSEAARDIEAARTD